MKIFGKQNKILYVQNPFTLKDLLLALFKKNKNFPFKEVLGLKQRMRTYTSEKNGSIHVLIPPLVLTINFLPRGFFYNKLLKLNGWIVRRSVAAYLKKLKMNEDLIHIVAFNPTLGVVTARRFNEKLLLYHCYDEIKEARWMKKHGPGFEEIFMPLSDAVIVTSNGLLEKKASCCHRLYVVKNGANVNLFSRAFTNEKSLRNVVGFIGNIDDRIDFALLNFLIESLPEHEFMLIGPVQEKNKEVQLKKWRNVTLTGSKPPEELPAYLKNFSVGIIPFQKNDFTKGIYPIKINEYLAAGIPVVATNFGNLDDFSGIISIAENKKEFKTFILDEIRNDTIQMRRKRQIMANQNTWENRAEEFSSVIEEVENKILTNPINLNERR